MKPNTEKIARELTSETEAKILVVDDDPQNRDLLRKSLGAAGYEIETADCGKQALEKINRAQFDLVLLDVLMPDMSGMEVLLAIRKIYSLCELPVLMVTARTQTESVVEAFKYGANDYITKPLDLRVVQARSKTHLALKQAEKKMVLALNKEKELAALRTQFLTMASHEFRTPLTVIMAASDILKRYGARMQEDEKAQSVGTIQQQVKIITDLLDEFMIMTEATKDRAELNLERLNLEQFCKQIILEIVNSKNPNHEIFLHNRIKEPVGKFDKRLLRQIISNLLSNAIKYSPEKSIIDFELREEKNEIRLRIKDNGIGIPPVEIEQVYAPFVRATNVGDMPGVGLGLAIVKKSVENYGGTIQCESILGKGTTFTVAIPNHKFKELLHEENLSH